MESQSKYATGPCPCAVIQLELNHSRSHLREVCRRIYYDIFNEHGVLPSNWHSPEIVYTLGAVQVKFDRL